MLRRSVDAWNLDSNGADIVLSASPAPDLAQLGRGIYELLDISPDISTTEEPVPHRRRWRRIPVNMPAGIRLRPIEDFESEQGGSAVIRNISQGGAFLTEIVMDEGTMPAVPFLMMLIVDQSPLDYWQAQCRPLRLHANSEFSSGVEFVSISDKNRQQIGLLAGDEQWL